MKATVQSGPLADVSADWLVIGVFHGEPLSPEVAELDAALGRFISQLAASRDLPRKVGECVPLLGQTAIRTPRTLIVGLGDRAKFGVAPLYRAAAAAARQIASKPWDRVAFTLLGEERNGLSTARIAETIIRAATVASYGQDLYRSEKKRYPFGEVILAVGQSNPNAELHEAVRRGAVVGGAVNFARRLVNEPPRKLFPHSFAQEAQRVAEQWGLRCTVFDQERLQAERMEALLAVAAGSDQPPRMVTLEYRPGAGGTQQNRLALVGKGVTFDSGGLSLKTAEQMETMKCDMAGAAAVLAAMQAIAELRLPVPVLGLMGLVENLPSGKAMKVGDVLRARNGMTIEVRNTDAEGRLVLADVLSYAVDQQVTHIVDLATLTGSCIIALGDNVCGLMSNDPAWAQRVQHAAEQVGEPVWPLPLFDDYAEQIQSEVADIKNTGGRPAGALTAAKFLERFVGNTSWVHLDIAGPAFAEKDTTWRDGGGTGCFVPTLVELAAGF